MNGSSPPSKDTPYLKFAKYLAGMDTRKPISAKQESEMWSCMTNTIIGVVMLILASALIYVASTDPAAASNRMYVYSVLIIVPILVAAYMMVPTFGAKPSGTKLTAYGIFVCALLTIAYFLMRNMSMKEIVYANYLIMFLGICVGIFLLVLIYKVSIRYLMSLEGWSGFVAKFVLYIPCLIRDLIIEIIAVMPNIPAKVAVLLLSAGLLVLVAYYAFNAISKTIRPSILLSSLIQTPFGNENPQSQSVNYDFPSLSNIFNMSFGNLNMPSDDFHNRDIHPLNVIISNDVTGADTSDLMHLSTTNSDTRAKNYTISAWIYLPQQTIWSRVLSLSKSSDEKTKGSPSVMYSSDKLRITLSNVDANPIVKEVPILPQKWNHIVFVYEDNVVNFYLNSELIFSEPLTDALPTYYFSDVLVSGDDTQIVGKIGGLAYVATPSTSQQIASIYNATRGFYV